MTLTEQKQVGMRQAGQLTMSREYELRTLELAVKCFTKHLTAEQIERLHRALMFKGPALDAINRIVKGELR